MRKVTQLVSHRCETRFWAPPLRSLPPPCLSFIPAILQRGGGEGARRCGLHFQAVDQSRGMGWAGHSDPESVLRGCPSREGPGKVTPLPDSASLTRADRNNHIGQSS